VVEYAGIGTTGFQVIFRLHITVGLDTVLRLRSEPLDQRIVYKVDKFFKAYNLETKILLPAWVLIAEDFLSKRVIQKH
jgi:hypothetical protein